MPEKISKTVIIGSGPAGLTASVYTARANLEPVCISGVPAGGQLMITTDVENFPGFPEGIAGPQLVANIRQQAEKFGTEFITAQADSIIPPSDAGKEPFTINMGDKTIQAWSVILATGARARLLPLESVNQLMGHGVSACATCDGFFFRGKEIMVVGGGDSAVEEAVFLTKFASKVYIVHRRDELRASKIMRERALSHEKIEILWNTVITDIYDVTEKTVTGVRLKDTATGEETDRKIDGVFFAIGHIPNTDFVKGLVKLDDKGYIIPEHHTFTSQEGIFAAGDVADSHYRQAATAAGSGCAAAIDCERWLTEKGLT